MDDATSSSSFFFLGYMFVVYEAIPQIPLASNMVMTLAEAAASWYYDAQMAKAKFDERQCMSMVVISLPLVTC